jgi:preprotein translocase subunit Sec61beta
MLIGGIITAFPAIGQALATENGMLFMTMAFFAASAIRFLEAHEWNSITVAPCVYAFTVAVYWLLLYMQLLRTQPSSLLGSSIVPACVIAVLLPGMDYVWQKIKPREIVSAGTLVKRRLQKGN